MNTFLVIVGVIIVIYAVILTMTVIGLSADVANLRRRVCLLPDADEARRQKKEIERYAGATRAGLMRLAELLGVYVTIYEYSVDASASFVDFNDAPPKQIRKELRMLMKHLGLGFRVKEAQPEKIEIFKENEDRIEGPMKPLDIEKQLRVAVRTSPGGAGRIGGRGRRGR